MVIDRRTFSAALLAGAATPLTSARGMAVEAEFLRRIHGGPDDRSRSRTLHGQANGSDDDRGEGKPSVAHLASAGDHRSDPGRCRPPRIASKSQTGLAGGPFIRPGC